MAKDYALSFYRSKAWRSCRKSYIAKRIMTDGGLCERCRSRSGYILHHKTELNPQNINNPDISLNHCNMLYLCKACHDDIHYNSLHGTKPCAMFDNNGNVIPGADRV